MLSHHLSEDAFGDPFDLADLPLARRASGYAVQRLDTDTLLDRCTGQFLPVRNTTLQALFDSFEAAREAARHWVANNEPASEDHGLAIVPAAYDEDLRRHILIYGVLCRRP